MNETIVKTAIVSAVGGGVLGGVITYLTVNRALRTRYEEWANAEIDSVKARYALLRKDEEGLDILSMAQNPSPEVQAAVDKGKAIIESMGYSGLHVKDETEVDEKSEKDEGLSIFDREDVIDLNKSDEAGGAEDDEDEDEEEDDDYEKVDDEPFKISEAMYFENDEGYTLDTLTYYEVDDTLVDEHDQVIDRVEETVGTRHLHMFHKDAQGNGKTSIYIQNDNHQTLYEVILNEGSYANIVLGMDEETLGIKAPKERPRRMRDGD